MSSLSFLFFLLFYSLFLQIEVPDTCPFLFPHDLSFWGFRHLSLFISSDFFMQSSCLLHNSASRECIMFLFYFYDTRNMINFSTQSHNNCVMLLLFDSNTKRGEANCFLPFFTKNLQRQTVRNWILIILPSIFHNNLSKHEVL